MLRVFLTLVLLMQSAVAVAGQAGASKPKLIVLIGVDQFRASYLERYADVYTGGLRRMMETGAWYPHAIVDHAPTLSLPGHTTLATGANPRTHGITSNAWITPGQAPGEDGLLRATVPYVDMESSVLGDGQARAYSPEHILVDGLADWVRQANPGARTVAISVTGLAALYGGKPAGNRDDNHVYWLDSTGKFLTSDYYRDDYPAWLERFNEGMAQKYLSRHRWELTVPEQYRSLARDDATAFEHDGIHTSFPHTATEMASGATDEAAFKRWFGRYSPYQNDALFDLAGESVRQLKLGQRDVPDLLCIAIKLTDRIGHDFGPRSLEQLDVIVRLDRLLGDFFDHLDSTVGEDNYVVALSADHGAPNTTEHERSFGHDSIRVRSEDFAQVLQAAGAVFDGFSGEAQSLPGLIAARLEEFPFIARAMTHEELTGDGPADPVLQAYRNSYLQSRTATYPLWTRENRYGNLVRPQHPANHGVIVELVENANIWAARSTHGGSYAYDREVPILIMGAGVRPRVAREAAYTRDVAPTLATLIGVAHPASVDGRVLKLD